MKTKTLLPSFLTSRPALSARFILSGLIAASATFVLAGSGAAQTVNPLSNFPVTLDGRFTNGVIAGTVLGEWSDVPASAFFSSPGNTAVPVAANDPTRNTLLYAALSRDTPTADPSLHLMYDFLPRTNPFVAPGEIFASVTFPVTLPNHLTGDRSVISVLFIGTGALTSPPPGTVGGSFFDVFVDLDLNGTPDVRASELGLAGAAGFGPSTLSNVNHLLVELEVGLRIQTNFGGGAGPVNPGGHGINPATGLYDPDPAFWGAAGGVGGPANAPAPPLQSASSGLFSINPDGSTNVTPMPEPASATLLLGSLAMFAARRRRAS